MRWVKTSVLGESISPHCFFWQNNTYLHKNSLKSDFKECMYTYNYIYTVSLFTNHMLACWWAALRLSTFLPVFFPIPAKELFEPHPVRGSNPKSALHICSPSSWDTLFTGTNLNRPFTPVWNHNSSHERLWKCAVRMTSTSSVIRFSFY